MALYVLDSDIFSMLIRWQPDVCRRVIALPAAELAVTIITVDESLRGWHAELRRARNDDSLVRAFADLQRTVEGLRDIRILAFDTACAALARRFRINDRRVGTNDLRIAATAATHSATLVTRNVTDFARFQSLVIEDWALPVT